MSLYELALILAGVLIVAFGSRRWLRRVTVYEYQSGLRFRNGRLREVLGPGRYWLIGSGARAEILDMRPRLVTVPGQEVLTKDSVSIKISLLLRFRLVDPRKALLNAEQFEQTLYAHAQVALRELVSSVTIEELLETRAQLDEAMLKTARSRADELGLEMLSLSIKDIMFPGALKEAFAQTARARQEGQARLERTRSESAALRNLANAARVMHRNPHLYELRLVHALSETKGSVVVHLGTPAVGDTDAEDDQPKRFDSRSGPRK